MRTFSAARDGRRLSALVAPGGPRERSRACAAGGRPERRPRADRRPARGARAARRRAARARVGARGAARRWMPRRPASPRRQRPCRRCRRAGTDSASLARDAGAVTPGHALGPAELVVIVGAAELGPCGSSGARFDVELDGALSPASVAELAWLCGLVAYERDGLPRALGRLRDARRGRRVRARRRATRARSPRASACGRWRTTTRSTRPGCACSPPSRCPPSCASRSTTSSRRARSRRRGARRRRRRHGSWHVVLAQGSQIRVPRTVRHSRRVAGQLPRGLDLARFGIPADLLASADRMALVNLACTAEAFAAAGITPEELLGEVHPALVANTQGCGMGGMASLRRLVHDGAARRAGRQADRLQESLGNVVAAHAVQSFVGSYGPMVHPVGACATAAISLEEAHDKIRAGKALAVLAGGFDDLTPDGVLGLRRHGRDRRQRRARGARPRAARGVARQRRAAARVRRGAGRRRAARRARRRRARARASPCAACSPTPPAMPTGSTARSPPPGWACSPPPSAAPARRWPTRSRGWASAPTTSPSCPSTTPRPR